MKPAIFTMTDAVLRVGETNYELAVDEARCEISASTATWKGIGGNTLPYLTETNATLRLTYPQDWKTAQSLSNYLHDHHGELQQVTLTPQAGGASFTMDVRMLAGSIGGTANQLASSSVTLPCSMPAKAPAPVIP